MKLITVIQCEVNMTLMTFEGHRFRGQGHWCLYLWRYTSLHFVIEDPIVSCVKIKQNLKCSVCCFRPTRAQESGSSLAMFFRSLAPNFNPQVNVIVCDNHIMCIVLTSPLFWTVSELWCLSGGKTWDYQNCSVLYSVLKLCTVQCWIDVPYLLSTSNNEASAELTTANGRTFTLCPARLRSQSRYRSLDQLSTCFNVIGYRDWLTGK